MSFVKWDKARRWTLRLYGPFNDANMIHRRYHTTVAVVASTPEAAMSFVCSKYPSHRLESCVDGGQIDFVVDINGVEQ